MYVVRICICTYTFEPGVMKTIAIVTYCYMVLIVLNVGIHTYVCTQL